jgi:hypothetical protein
MGKLKRTIKEQQFLKAYIELKGNATKAYLKVFPHVKKESACVLGANLLAKINLSISELMEKMGITDHILNKKLQEGLNATTGTGDKKKPNYYVRAKYMDMIFRLKARYPIDESRLKLPGMKDGATSVTLREIVYSKDGKKKIKEKIEIARSEDKPPF